MESERESIRWWLWPNVLGLDAPFVAIVWLFAFSYGFGFEVEPPVYLVLFLTVWCIYLGDRLHDVWRPDRTEFPVVRRRFARENFRLLCVLLGVLLVSSAALAPTMLSRPVLLMGVVVAMFVGLYFYLFVVRRLPGKEVAAGFLFAIGVVLPGMGGFHESPGRWVPALLIFGLVSGYNCYLIDRNERRTTHGTGGRRDATMLGVAAFVTAMIPAAFNPGAAWLFFSLGLSAALLTALQIYRREMSREAFRVLADVVLLTPILCLPFLA